MTSPSRIASLAVATAALAFATSARAEVIDYPDSPDPVATPIVTTLADPVSLSIVSGSAIQSGEISGDGGLTKIGAGTITLTANNTYTGPTEVEAGALIVDGFLTGNVTVQSGATFGGDGIVAGDITLVGGSTLLVVDCFDADTLVWNPTAKMVFSLGDSTSDILELGAGLTKGGSGSYLFEFADAGWQVGQTYTLIVFNETTFLNAEDFAFTNGGGFAGSFSLKETTVEFTLTSAVPEPSTYAIGVCGLLGVAIWLRRRGLAARA